MIGYWMRRRRSPRGSGISVRFGGAVKNSAQNLQDVMIRLWHFPLPIEALLPYGWPVLFSHILLLNLVQARMGPVTTSFLYFLGVCCPSYSTVHRLSRIGLPPMHLPCDPVWGDSTKATHRPRKMGFTGHRTCTFQGAWGDLRNWWMALDYETSSAYNHLRCLLHCRFPPQLISGRGLITFTYITWWS